MFVIVDTDIVFVVSFLIVIPFDGKLHCLYMVRNFTYMYKVDVPSASLCVHFIF